MRTSSHSPRTGAESLPTTRSPTAPRRDLFSEAGIPTVVCGPGDIAQAHAPDEFIELEQIAACESFVDALIADLTDRS
jgi:acetylornithine deacetylase/succinyl-diaminopimelate desuccinylase-like protein